VPDADGVGLGADDGGHAQGESARGGGLEQGRRVKRVWSSRAEAMGVLPLPGSRLWQLGDGAAHRRG
jgi:hypothetical protein